MWQLKCHFLFLWLNFLVQAPVSLPGMSWATFYCNLQGRYVTIQRYYNYMTGLYGSALTLTEVYFYIGQSVEQN